MSLNAARHNLNYERLHSLLRANGVDGALITIRERPDHKRVTIKANGRQSERLIDAIATPAQVAASLREMVGELM